ncbi:MAG: RNA 2',3'-cyclic phosphodiesterase [Actinomycetota bacterium]
MRLFVAVWPPAPVVTALAGVVEALRRRDGSGQLRWTEPAQWHVTLRFLGRADVDVATAAYRAVAPAAVPVEARLGPATGRFGRRVLHVPASGLEGLAAATVAATAGVGDAPQDHGFAGHLTLARARPRGGVDLAPLAGVAVSGRWEVAELTLVASVTGTAGARYEVLASLPVGRPPGEQGPAPGP